MPQKGKKKTADTRAGEDQDQYEQSPEGYQSLWEEEFKAADRELKVWHKQASEVEKVYNDDRKDVASETDKRTCLFTVNTVNEEALLYGRVPQTDVVRKYMDANDEVARVAGMMMQRILNGDIERPDDRFARACGYALSDHLRTNFGCLRFRYDMEQKTVPAQKAVMRPDPQTGQMVEAVPAVEEHQEKVWEDVPTEYVHWRDVKWSPCRVWEQARWVAFRLQMTRRELKKRFPKDGARVVLNSKRIDKDDADTPEDQPRFPWDRADVWEIWSKEHGKVFWFVEGWKRILDVIDDPLELKDFWPLPRPMVAWITTTRFLPKPEYLMAQDSYKSIDHLTTRIDLLVSALRVMGIFDENFKELQTILDSTEENTMVPVSNWNTVATEKGGIEGLISWFPLEQVVAVLEQLRAQRDQEIEMNYQLTGRADLMRGALENPNETATASRAKIKFASKRIQRKQDMFAEFVSDAQRIRAEIILKMFDDDTLRARSNIDNTEDAQLAEQAIKLLREEGVEGYRVTVKSENLSLPDFAEMKQDGTEFITAMGNMIGMLGKLPPVALPIVPELASALKWYASKFRGAVELEGAMERMAKKLQKLADNPPQSGDQGDQAKVQAQQLKNQGDQQKIALESKAREKEIHLETQAEIQKQEAEMKYNTEETRQKALIEHQLQQETERTKMQHEAGMREREMQHEQIQFVHEERREQEDHERQMRAEEHGHAQQLQLEQQKAKTGVEQLRMKGKQAVQLARMKPKLKPGGKK